MNNVLRSTYAAAGLCLLVGLAVPAYAQEPGIARMHVDRNDGVAAPPNFGQNGWDNDAYRFLQVALFDAPALLADPLIDTVRIWVAAGTEPYLPIDPLGVNCPPTCNRDRSFRLINDVELYGGFAGVPAETQLSDRDVDLNITILSGDIDDDGSEANNSYHVVRALSTIDATARLDGFVIRAGNADGTGAQHTDIGGGILSSGSPTIVNCTITANEALNGAGVFCPEGSTVSFVNCTISNNDAVFNGGGVDRGVIGEVEPAHPAFPTFTNCLIAGNYAGVNGGGLYLVDGGGPLIINCTIVDNEAGSLGGGYFESDQFYDIQAPTVPTSFILNSILWDNTLETGLLSGRQIHIATGVVLTVDFSDVQDGEGDVGGDRTNLAWGPGNIDVDPIFSPPFVGTYRLYYGSPCIDAARNSDVPADGSDVDDDTDTTEKTPDLDRADRLFDDPDSADCPYTGDPADCGTAPIADMGSYEFVSCPEDTNGDCLVNVLDLVDLLNCFGLPATPPCDTGQDVNGDGNVDVLDLVQLVLRFGEPCSCAPPETPIPSLEEELNEAGLDMDDWDDFMDVMQNGEEEEKENYKCWMIHYLSECPNISCPPNCPDDDPFDQH